MDYASLKRFGIEERAHKAYLNNFFRGYEGGSISQGELYNEDLVTGDARLCGTTASLCGLQTALLAEDAEAITRSINAIVMLHAYMFMQSGIPVLYSGDEIGQLNDETYHNDRNKVEDSRYLHRGKMDWAAAANADKPGTHENRIFTALAHLERIRTREKAFACAADAAVIDIGDRALLGIRRSLNSAELLGVFNFGDKDKTATIATEETTFLDLLSGTKQTISQITVPPQGFFWLKKS